MESLDVSSLRSRLSKIGCFRHRVLVPNYNSSAWYGLRLKSKAPHLPSITNDEESQLSKLVMLAVGKSRFDGVAAVTLESSESLRIQSIAGLQEQPPGVIDSGLPRS